MSASTRRHGRSLAKGPAGLIGLALLAYGVTGLIFGSSSFTEQAPDGTVDGDTWLGIEANGWSNLLFAAAGALLVFSAPFHWAAKTSALVAGLVLGSAALIALGDGDDALGIFAADDRTRIAWGAAAVVLLLIALLPRVGRTREAADDEGRSSEDRATRRLHRHDAERAPDHAERETGYVDREPVHADREPGYADREPAYADRAPDHRDRDGVVDRPHAEPPAEHVAPSRR